MRPRSNFVLVVSCNDRISVNFSINHPKIFRHTNCGKMVETLEVLAVEKWGFHSLILTLYK